MNVVFVRRLEWPEEAHVSHETEFTTISFASIADAIFVTIDRDKDQQSGRAAVRCHWKSNDGETRQHESNHPLQEMHVFPSCVINEIVCSIGEVDKVVQPFMQPILEAAFAADQYRHAGQTRQIVYRSMTETQRRKPLTEFEGLRSEKG